MANDSSGDWLRAWKAPKKVSFEGSAVESNIVEGSTGTDRASVRPNPSNNLTGPKMMINIKASSLVLTTSNPARRSDVLYRSPVSSGTPKMCYDAILRT